MGRQHHWSGFVVLCTGLLLWIGCDAVGTGTSEVDRQYVVEAYLIAGEPLPSVRLTRTTPIDEPSNYEARAVEAADVVVELLDEAGEPEARYPYRTREDTAGVYMPVDGDWVIPLRTYRLVVTTPSDERIIATTTVPDTFSIVQANARRVVYQGSEQLALTLTPSRYPGRDQGFYIFSTEALAPSEENLTPLIREVVEGTEDDISLDDLRVTSSPIINEESYEQNPDGTVTVRLPWLAIAFYGPNRTTANVIDDNLYDFVRTQNVQQGGGFTPGSIPNVVEHVDGGTGVFGSLARQSREVVILRRAEAAW